MYYINTIKQELGTAKIYEHNLLDEKYVVDRHRCHMAAKFGVFVYEDQSKLPTLNWLPKLYYPISYVLMLTLAHVLLLSFVDNLTSCLTAIKRGSSTLYEIYIGFCPRTEFYKIL